MKNIEKYKAELNKSFQELVKVDENKLVIDSFKKSQILWNKFIIEDCKFMNSPISLTQGEGYIIVCSKCLGEHYNKRVKKINKVINNIK
ncbi:lysozyme inhibitor LprI family protein [Aggregatibacter aphrophilus]|uniref:lysozyme inhibitor LprI family protein n=1 Tax=Aggregatibacter aphrophilus TaxID=732 RepID=UPI000D64943E